MAFKRCTIVAHITRPWFKFHQFLFRIMSSLVCSYP